MSNQQNRTIAYLISSLLVVGGYAFYVSQKYQAGSFDSTAIPSSWGLAILIVIGVQIILSVIMVILFSIIKAVITRDDKFLPSDERDQMIALKANQISYIVFGIGFLLAMVTLAVGLPALVMFNLIVFSLFGAGIGGHITQLHLYRRGF